MLLQSHVWIFVTPWTAPHQASLSVTISWNLEKEEKCWRNHEPWIWSILRSYNPQNYMVLAQKQINFLELAQIHVHWVSDAIQASHLLLSPSSPVFPSIRVFSNESALHSRWLGLQKVLGFSFRISPSNEYSGLVSFRIDWFDLLAAQRTLQSVLQHHNLKTSILWCSVFFMIQLWHQYVTAVKTICYA